jgi:hypothetical protein
MVLYIFTYAYDDASASATNYSVLDIEAEDKIRPDRVSPRAIIET